MRVMLLLELGVVSVAQAAFTPVCSCYPVPLMREAGSKLVSVSTGAGCFTAA